MTNFWLAVIAGTLLFGSAAMIELFNGVLKIGMMLAGGFILIWLITNLWPYITELLSATFPWIILAFLLVASVYASLLAYRFVCRTYRLFRGSTLEDLAPAIAAFLVLGAIVFVWGFE